MRKNVAIYNDNTCISEKMELLFAGEDIFMRVVHSIEELLSLLRDDAIRLMLIDVELQGKDWREGVKALSRIRTESRIPMIVVSAQSAEAAKIMALNAGADDYVTADCNPLELLARVKSQLNRYQQLVSLHSEADRIYRIDGLVVNDMCRRVTVDGREIKLTPTEYNILRLLVQERGKVLSVRQIYESAWHMRAVGADNTIAVHIRHIREKIEQNPNQPRYLKVMWGCGYKVG